MKNQISSKKFIVILSILFFIIIICLIRQNIPIALDETDTIQNQTKLDIRQIELQVLNLINQERERFPLLRDSELDLISKENNPDIFSNELFSQEEIKQKTLQERLKEREIIYYDLGEIFVLNKIDIGSNISLEIFNSLLNSNKSLIAEKFHYYDHFGIDVNCEEASNQLFINCYTTATFLKQEINWNSQLLEDLFIFLPIFPIGSDSDVTASVNLNSSDKIELILVESAEDFERWYRDEKYNVKGNIDISSKDYSRENVLIKKGYGFIIGNKNEKVVNYTLRVIPKKI